MGLMLLFRGAPGCIPRQAYRGKAVSPHGAVARIRERLSALDPQSVELLDESGRHVGHAGAAAAAAISA